MRLGGVAAQADAFFTSDAGTHAQWAAFADENHVITGPSGSVGASTGQVSGAVSASPLVKAAHERWAQLIDRQVLAFVGTAGMGEEEFYATLRLSRDEERRDGLHFYRWMEVIEIDAMVALLAATAAARATGIAQPPGAPPAEHPGVRAALAHVNVLSQKARSQHRRDATLLPLLCRWSPDSFASVEAAVREGLRQAGQASAGGKAHLKAMAQWRVRLQQQVLDPATGAYGPLPRDEAEWGRYAAAAASPLGGDAFDTFASAIEDAAAADAHARAISASTAAAGAGQRAAALRCFVALDVFHRGHVAVAAVLRLLEVSGALTQVGRRKLAARLAAERQHLQQQRTAAAAAVSADASGVAAESSELLGGSSGDDEGSQSIDGGPRADIPRFLDIIDAAIPAGVADRLDRLAALEEAVRSRV